MLDQLKALQAQIEHDSETPLTSEEINFLENITTTDDLHRQYLPNSSIQSLAYDVALIFGLSEIEALVITGEADPASLTKIKLYYHDGEYLSGYTVHGAEAEMLQKIGLAKYVDGWGYYVNDAAVKALGTEFLYHQALELSRPALEARKFTEDAEKAARERIFAEAARTGQSVVLDEYTDDCNDPREECSLDNVTVYAMPDGKTKTTRSHTW